MVSPGPSNAGPSSRCDAAAVVGEFVVAAPSQHVGRTASMPGWTRQSRAAAPFIARPAFHDYGCWRPYGGIGVRAETHPEAVLATSTCWWQRGSTPRWVSHGLLPSHGVHRSAAAARTRTRCPFRTALSRPRADRSPLLPSQVARWSPPSPPTAAARSPEVVGALARPLPPPPASPPPTEASRARCARAARVHMSCACTCT